MLGNRPLLPQAVQTADANIWESPHRQYLHMDSACSSLHLCSGNTLRMCVHMLYVDNLPAMPCAACLFQVFQKFTQHRRAQVWTTVTQAVLLVDAHMKGSRVGFGMLNGIWHAWRPGPTPSFACASLPKSGVPHDSPHEYHA